MDALEIERGGEGGRRKESIKKANIILVVQSREVMQMRTCKWIESGKMGVGAITCQQCGLSLLGLTAKNYNQIPDRVSTARTS